MRSQCENGFSSTSFDPFLSTYGKADIILPSQCDLDIGNIESMQLSCKARVYAERQGFSSELDTLAFKSVFSFVPIFFLKQTTQCYLTPVSY